ncbi:MAG: exopolyphosphatase, partial [Rhodospirillales bacterium]
MDSRTGLEHNKDFSISNYQLMVDFIDYCRTMSIDEILGQDDVKERVDRYFEQADKAKEQIRRCTAVHQNLAVFDLREEETIFPANRFLIYA